MTDLQPTDLAFGWLKIMAFAWVSSPVILMNHTPLGRVYTRLIFSLRC